MRHTPLSPYAPLVAHILPTLLIAYGVVIPRSCIAGFNELTIGFGASVVGTCIAYVVGVRSAIRDPRCHDPAPT
jgi:hypothetical protein